MSGPSPEERLGASLAGRYRLDRILGRGGMGVVYAGVHTWTGRPVAVKLLLPELSASESAVQRFLREARSAAESRHPNVVDVLDMGAEPEGVYLVLELLEGESLGERLERTGALTTRETIAVLEPILRALATLHGRGLVHRDLKPDNVFLSRDGAGAMIPKLLDFGISKRLARGETVTREGTLLGTPHYMSPEQMRSAKDITAASDIWSMGVLLYECVAGALPFAVESIPQLVYAVTQEGPRPLRELAPAVPEALLAVVDASIARDPADRFADAAAFADALAELARDQRWDLARVRAEWPAEASARPAARPDPSDTAGMLEATRAASEVLGARGSARRPASLDRDPTIRFFEGPTGHRVAYAEHGEGPPLVCAAWWVSHLEADWRHERFRRFFGGLAEHFTVYRYDRPGSGLSDRDRESVTLEEEVATLEALLDHLGLDRISLLAVSCGGAPAMTVATRRPERVGKLVLFGSFVSGEHVGDESARDAVQHLVGTHWGMGAKVITDLFDPELGSDERADLSRTQRSAASKEMAAAMLTLTFDVRVQDVASAVRVPTLVLHRKKDGAVPFSAGRELAACVPSATLQGLEGKAHVPWLGDVDEALGAVLRFLRDDA